MLLYFHRQSSITTRASVRVHSCSRSRHSSRKRASDLRVSYLRIQVGDSANRRLELRQPSISSASMHLRRAFSFCSSLSCLTWSTSIMPNSHFQRWKVYSLICCSRHTSRVALSVLSASRSARIFCSVVYLSPFMIWVLSKGPD